MAIEHLSRGDVVELPRAEFERIEATLELLENQAVKEGVLTGLREHQAGKSRPWTSVRDEI